MSTSMAVSRVERLTGISVKDAQLPDNFKRMLDQIDECTRVDECKDWASKAASAASYYRQFMDCEKLVHKFERLAIRAKLRCREILDSIENDQAREEKRVAAGIKLAEYRQTGDALKVPHAERERLIERSPPASLAKLAKIGNPPAIYRPQPGTGSAPGFAALVGFWKMCRTHNASDEAARIDTADLQHVQNMLQEAEHWLSEFDRLLPRQKALGRRHVS